MVFKRETKLTEEGERVLTKDSAKLSELKVFEEISVFTCTSVAGVSQGSKQAGLGVMPFSHLSIADEERQSRRRA